MSAVYRAPLSIYSWKIPSRAGYFPFNSAGYDPTQELNLLKNSSNNGFPKLINRSEGISSNTSG